MHFTTKIQFLVIFFIRFGLIGSHTKVVEEEKFLPQPL